MQKVKNLINSLFFFLKKPIYKPEFLTPKEKIVNVLIILVFKIALVIPLIFILDYLDSKKLIPASSYKFESKTLEILTIVIFAPLFEEILFRNPLNSPKWSVGIIGMFLIWAIAQLPLLWGFNLLLFPSVLTLIWLIGWIAYKPSKSFLMAWKQHYFWIFNLMALTFGLIHLTNYKLENIIWWVLPFLCISQIIGGYLLGFVRLRYGLRFSILLHALFNVSVTIFSYLDNISK